MNLWSEIPRVLKAERNFALWKFEDVNGKTTKIPYQLNGRRASSTDPSTWITFDACCDAYANGGFDGIGIFLAKAYGLTGIDFDKCRDPDTGEILPDVREVIKKFDSYSEISVSGTGVHIIVFADHNGNRNRKGDIEIYDDKRFFVFTGDRIKTVSGHIEHRQDELNELYASIFSDDGHDEPKQRVEKITDLSNDDVIEKASNAKNGDKFKRLFFEGDWSEYTSPSEADLALCDVFRFYCGDDPSHIDLLFQQSALMRPKWNEKHGSQTYGELTISKSLDGGDVYGASRSSITTEFGDPSQYFEGEGKNKRFVPKRLGDAILEGHRFIRLLDTDEIFVYNPDTGLYEGDAEALIRKEAKQRLGELYNTHRVNEAFNYIRDGDYVSREDVEPPVNLIPAANGILDITSWLNGDFESELPRYEYSPDVAMFVKHAGTYRPELLEPEHPTMTLQFIKSIFPQEEIDTVQELIGACFYRGQHYKKAFMLLGDGDNGKSIFLNMLRKTLGEPVVSKQSLYALAYNRFASADLYHKNANIHADLGGGDLAFVGTFMILTGGDSLTVERKHQNCFSYVCYAVLIFSTNALPYVKNPPDQFYNRWILVEMPYKFVDHPDTGNDYEKLRLPEQELEAQLQTQDEIDFLFTWGIEGLKRLLQNGHYTESNSTKAIKSRWISKTDSLQAFVNEMVEVSEGSRVRKSVFKAAYEAWCGANEMYAQTDANIGKNLPRFIPTKSIQTKPRSWANIVIRGEKAERMTEMPLDEGQTSLEDSKLGEDEQ
jgi:putative DNA primase/helicase